MFCYKCKNDWNCFLLVTDKFMPGMLLKELSFTYSACGLFWKRRKNWKVYANWKYKHYLEKKYDKACFQHYIAYGKSKDFVKRTQSDKVLKNKVFKIASDPKYDGYQRGLGSVVYNLKIRFA